MDNFEWPDMPIENIPQNTLNPVYDDYGKSHLNNENIYEFLKFCHVHCIQSALKIVSLNCLISATLGIWNPLGHGHCIGA